MRKYIKIILLTLILGLIGLILYFGYKTTVYDVFVNTESNYKFTYPKASNIFVSSNVPNNSLINVLYPGKTFPDASLSVEISDCSRMPSDTQESYFSCGYELFSGETHRYTNAFRFKTTESLFSKATKENITLECELEYADEQKNVFLTKHCEYGIFVDSIEKLRGTYFIRNIDGATLSQTDVDAQSRIAHQIISSISFVK